jgi:aminopeptidase N
MDAQRDRLTQQEAEQRAGQVSGVSYRVDLDFEAHAKVFRGDVEVEFDHSGGDTFIELCRGEIDSFSVNGVEVEHNRRGTRIPLPAAMLDERNRVRVRYTRPYDRTGEGIHHFNDPEDGAEYLYTQFEPYGAHRLFPCFDQPDLKATYEFVVTAPSDWVVTTATRPEGDEDVGAGRRRRTFARSVPFSTYLASVVAGEYRGVESSHDGIPLGLYARRTLIGHLEKDAGSLFEITGKALDYFSEMFAEPYPFSKVDQMFVPEFNWGGMENVANITYTDNVIFRDPPTIDQIRRRDEYFAHELAHMWFGDLVTMRWWDDVWLNESFASYVAYRGCLARLSLPNEVVGDTGGPAADHP